MLCWVVRNCRTTYCHITAPQLSKVQCCDVVLCCQELPNNIVPHHSTSAVTSPVLWCCTVLSGAAEQHSATSQLLSCQKSSAVMLHCVVRNCQTTQCNITALPSAAQMSQVQYPWWCFHLVYKFVAQVFCIFLLWVMTVRKVVLIFCIVLVNTAASK